MPQQPDRRSAPHSLWPAAISHTVVEIRPRDEFSFTSAPPASPIAPRLQHLFHHILHEKFQVAVALQNFFVRFEFQASFSVDNAA